jgi:ribosomal-protein-alanine N-acetyltransferase
MAFFRTVSFAEPLPTIEGAEVFLRAPQMSDYSEWATLREASRAFLTPWEPTWPADDLGRSAFRRRLRRYAEDQRADSSYAFFLFRKSDHALVGGLTLANIRRGVAQAGSLGYWTGEPFARRGLMSGAVSALVPFAFSSLRLHRISLHQRDVAGPFALCPPEWRADGLAAAWSIALTWVRCRRCIPCVRCLGLAKVRLL